jgi:hypothetical protein
VTAAVRTTATPPGVAVPAETHKPRRHYVMTDRDGRALIHCPDCHGSGWDPYDAGFECVRCAGLAFLLSEKWSTAA